MKMEHDNNHQNSPKIQFTSTAQTKHHQDLKHKKFKTQNKYDHNDDSDFSQKDQSN
jgi:hypothetical protein